ncbi:hypothetical protein ACPRR3_09530 [Enterobacter asburiae]|jgi:hypothetical protein|uniref:Uncharacterized protein n=2 Tax=Enterobacteriaceae TaxID=543 RepID=A0A762RTR4_SALER|nr:MULTISPECIES: hypothetical protein [Enterobacteriaceae]EBF8336640.1 hypothetical protein [Salmonella enterica subsp. enterica serovar Tees]EBL4920501.1 hypothetical protein [Salmonella enterica subsp. enterica serovar Montevideo]EKY0313751.1 hypothetical protein [Citrobacter freundii]ESA29140.1 hypothetical protein L912_1384 [Escherichia coli SCD1]HAF2720905.1 hypothetical protein [Salmonella enterica]
MKARHKRRTRRATISQSEQETLSRISAQLERLQTPVSPDILGGINDKLSRIDVRLTTISDDAASRGASAGAITGGIAGGVITVAILLIRAKLEL